MTVFVVTLLGEPRQSYRLQTREVEALFDDLSDMWQRGDIVEIDIGDLASEHIVRISFPRHAVASAVFLKLKYFDGDDDDRLE